MAGKRKKLIMTCRVCKIHMNAQNSPLSFLTRNVSICRICDANERKKRYAKYRLEIIQKLGNKCNLCSCDNYNLLSIDHISGNGNKEKKNVARGYKFIKIVNRLDEKDLKIKFQCLCYNCNYVKGFWKTTPATWKNEIIDITNIPKYKEFVFNSDKHSNVNCHDCQNLINADNCGILNSYKFYNKLHCKYCESKRLSKYRYLKINNYDDYKANLVKRQIKRLFFRLEMLNAYGNECVFCGEKHPLNLTLDHVQNNGNHDDGGIDFYQQLKKLGYPGKGKQLQLLCHNCNAHKEYIDNRKENSETIISESTTYIKQYYNISDVKIKELEKMAIELYIRIQNNPA